jgi:hypothetical protein
VIQWLYTESLCTLFQRLGRAARAPGIEATGIYLVEREHFDWYKARKEAGQKARAEKRKSQSQSGPSSNLKKQRTGGEVAQVSASTHVEEPDTDSDNDGEDRDVDSIPVPEAIPFSTIKGPFKTYDHLPSRSGLSTEEYEKACMDAYINARSRGWCRREIGDEYFQNHLCSKSSIEYVFPILIFFISGPVECHCNGRCGGRPTRYCCDTCNPAHFLLRFVARPPATKRGKKKIKVTPYMMGPRDFDLRCSLNEWRQQQLLADFGDDDFFGPQQILTDQIRDRIVDLAHDKKIVNVETLQQQTDWVYTETYGAQILKIIERHAPPPPPLPFVSTPLQPRTLDKSLAIQPSSRPTAKARAPSKCGSCHQTGHTGRYSNQKISCDCC